MDPIAIRVKRLTVLDQGFLVAVVRVTGAGAALLAVRGALGY
jgi:hypothetical protein